MVKLELKHLKKITSWNGFPSRTARALICRFSSNALDKNHTTANNSEDKDEPVTIWHTILYIGEKTSQLLRSFKRKLRRRLKNPNTPIRIREKTTKLGFYNNNNDKVPLLNKSHVVYKFSCPGCQSSYIGKTNRTLLIRTREHAVTDKESAIYKHLRTCEHLAFIHNLFNSLDTLNNVTTPSISGNNEYAINVVQNNTTVLDYDDNWNLLLYKEAFHIKRQSSSLNNGLKSSRELCLFS